MSLHLNFEAKDLATAEVSLNHHFPMIPFVLKTVETTYNDPTEGEVTVCTYVAYCTHYEPRALPNAKYLQVREAVRRATFDLSVDLGEDCIGVSFDGGKTGQLCGPLSCDWPPFNPEYFKV